jgi:hypothetical protein
LNSKRVKAIKQWPEALFSVLNILNKTDSI